TRADDRRGRGIHERAVQRHGRKEGEVTSAAMPAAAPTSTGAKTADVFVVFGITGDLAKVMTFHSLYRLEQRGLLQCPIVGVAVNDWSIEHLPEHVRQCIIGTVV